MLAGVRAAQSALDVWLGSLPEVDPARPSRLPGWTVGHVLAHLAGNAAGHVRLLQGLPQYDGGVTARDAAIEAGARRPFGQLVGELRTAQAVLDAAWQEVTEWYPDPATLADPRPYAELPFLRWREVEIHRFDLGPIDGAGGYAFADMPSEYVRRELAKLTMRYRASKPLGLTQLPEAAATAPPPLRLAWLTGRAEIAGLPPAAIL